MEDDERFPIGVDITASPGKPFVAATDEHLRNKVIVRTMTLTTFHGHVIYVDYEMVNDNPTEEEIFKTELANPQPLVAVKVNTELVDRYRLKDS